MKDRFLLSYDSIAFLFQIHECAPIHENKRKGLFIFFDVSVLPNGQCVFKKVPNHISLPEM